MTRCPSWILSLPDGPLGSQFRGPGGIGDLNVGRAVGEPGPHLLFSIHTTWGLSVCGNPLIALQAFRSTQSIYCTVTRAVFLKCSQIQSIWIVGSISGRTRLSPQWASQGPIRSDPCFPLSAHIFFATLSTFKKTKLLKNYSSLYIQKSAYSTS